MGTFIMIAQLILALAILVSLHEWGHYIAARSFGIKVEKFYIFFDAWGIKLFSKQVNDTEWGIGWLPLGGYVKIAGMIDESLDKDQLESEPEDHEFRSKPAWQRLIVMIGGVTVNFILGILIFALSLWYFGDTWLPSKAVNENGIEVSSLGAEAGFENGDKLLALNGESLEKFRAYSNPDLFVSDDGAITYTVERNSEKQDIEISGDIKSKFLESKGLGLFLHRTKSFVKTLSPYGKDTEIDLKEGDQIVGINGTTTVFFDELRDELKKNKGEEVALAVIRENDTITVTQTLDTTGAVGFERDLFAEFENRFDTTRYGFVESFPEGTRRGMEALNTNVKAFGQMFKGKLNPVKTVSGPIGIAKVFGTEWNWKRFWNITGVLSFILAFMNLLPIPALDGGHVVFLLIEMLRGKPLPEKVMYNFQMIGMFILLALMALIVGIDIFNLF